MLVVRSASIAAASDTHLSSPARSDRVPCTPQPHIPKYAAVRITTVDLRIFLRSPESVRPGADTTFTEHIAGP